jgi:hypothetical protein
MATFYTFSVGFHLMFATMLPGEGFVVCGCLSTFILLGYFFTNIVSHFYTSDEVDWNRSRIFDLLNLRMETISAHYWGGALSGRIGKTIGWEREMRAEYSKVYRFWLVRHLLLNCSLLAVHSYVALYAHVFKTSLQSDSMEASNTAVLLTSNMTSNTTMILNTTDYANTTDSSNSTDFTRSLRGLLSNSTSALISDNLAMAQFDRLRLIFESPFYYMLGLSIVMTFAFSVDSFYARFSDHVSNEKRPLP